MNVLNMAKPTTRNRIWKTLGKYSISQYFFSSIEPSNQGFRIDVSVSDSGHCDDHTVDTLEVRDDMDIVKQRWISVVLYQVNEPRGRPPDREEHHDDLQ